MIHDLGTAPRARRSAAILLTALAGWCGASCGGIGGSRSPEQSLAEYDVARDAFSNGQIREALEHINKALDLDSENAEAAYFGAVIMLTFCASDVESSDCRFDEAEAFARQAIEADAELRDAKNALGVILIHQGRYPEAVETLEPLSKDILYNSPEKAWGNLGWAYLEANRLDEAVDALRRSIAAQPLFCVGQYRLGLAYEKQGDLEGAKKALTRAVETERDECQRLQDAFDARGRIHVKLGEKDMATSDYERCKEIAASTPVGQQCAAQLKTLQ